MVTVWYTYVDWTTESTPRPFNVGKGTLTRVADVLARNTVWHRIAQKHGHRREVVFSSHIESECFDHEQQLIIKLKTCPHLEGGWGANLSLGGPGPTGAKWTLEARERLSRMVTDMWRDPSYRQKLMTPPPVSRSQLETDSVLTWDDIASKYDVSATTVKRWFKEWGLIKITSTAGKRKAWSLEEDEELMQLYHDDWSVRAMAQVLGRSECSVKKRVQKVCNVRNIERSRYRKCT